MTVNTNEVKKLVKEKFRGNFTWFAEEIGIDRSYVSTLMNNPTKKSNSFCNAIIEYCQKNNLDFKKFIFFD